MPVAQQRNWFASHWPYLLGAVLVHVVIGALFGLNLLDLQRKSPPPMLAIQAVVVDPKQFAQPQRNVQQERERARKEAEAKAAAEAQRKEQEEAANREQEQKAEQERQEVAKREAEQREQQQREEQARVAKETERRQQEQAERQRKVEAERQAKLEAERQAKLAAERQAKAKAEAERQRVEEIQRKQREREEAERKRLQAETEARERALQEQLAAEEGVMSARNSPAMGQYVALIQQHVERRWIRPPSARSGIECEVSVTQSPSGTVLRVQVGRCNGDQAVRQSIENAVQKASPLPLPSDMRLFERNLQFIFRPAA